MSLEKGVSRLGTVSGVIFGIFFSLTVTLFSVEHGLFNYLSNRFSEKEVVVTNFRSGQSKQDPLAGFYVDDLVEDKFIDKTTFDYEGAKNAGYSDEEINKHLSSKEKIKPILPSGWKIEEEPKSTKIFFSYYLPTFFMVILVILISFMLGLYSVKGVAKTINWVIKGFRE